MLYHSVFQCSNTEKGHDLLLLPCYGVWSSCMCHIKPREGLMARTLHDDWSPVWGGGYSSSPGETETQRELFQLVRYGLNKKPNLLPAAPLAPPETANQIKTGMMQTKAGSTLQFEWEVEGDKRTCQVCHIWSSIRYSGFGLCLVFRVLGDKVFI